MYPPCELSYAHKLHVYANRVCNSYCGGILVVNKEIEFMIDMMLDCHSTPPPQLISSATNIVDELV